MQRGEDIFSSCAIHELTIRRPGGVWGRLSQLIPGMWVWSLGELRAGLINLNIEMVLINMKWYRCSFPLFWHRTQRPSQPHQVAESREQMQEDLRSCCTPLSPRDPSVCLSYLGFFQKVKPKTRALIQVIYLGEVNPKSQHKGTWIETSQEGKPIQGPLMELVTTVGSLSPLETSEESCRMYFGTFYLRLRKAEYLFTLPHTSLVNGCPWV